jgi:hypothetical protein
MNKKKIMMFEIMSGSTGGGGGADVSGVTATAPDVDEGKIFVDNTGAQVVGTSTYKADYIALRTDIDNLNDTLEPVLLGDGSDTNVYANVSNVTATASDVAQGKVFVNNSGQEVTGTATDSTADLIKIVERPSYATINLPNGVTKIADNSFSGYRLISGVNIPNTVTSIGSYAFMNCIYFSTTLSNSITSLGSGAFYGCNNLVLTELPSNLTTIPQSCFNSCKKITITTIPQSVTRIEEYAFSNCIGLTDLTFLNTPDYLSPNAFAGCYNITTIKVPWSEGAVSGAPWGASNATIVYNYTPS